jgi:hypothetical protein
VLPIITDPIQVSARFELCAQAVCRTVCP